MIRFRASAPLRLAMLSLLCLMPAACGFTPLYGQHGDESFGNEDLLSYVYIDSIPNREGQYLRNALIDRFYRDGRPADPQYTLKIVNLETRRIDLDITRTSSSTREQVRLKAHLILSDRKTGETLLTSRLSATASYNVLESEFATRISRGEAQDNALSDLARQIEVQTTLFFQREEKQNQP